EQCKQETPRGPAFRRGAPSQARRRSPIAILRRRLIMRSIPLGRSQQPDRTAFVTHPPPRCGVVWRPRHNRPRRTEGKRRTTMPGAATGYLVVKRDDGYGDVHTLTPGQRYTLGRATTNSIVLKDDLCSREHAEISFSEGRWHLRD